MLRKLKALIQWWMALEVQEHRHWCKIEPSGQNTGRCEHQSSCWYCTGVFCANIERKDCPKCAALTDAQKLELDKAIIQKWKEKNKVVDMYRHESA